MELRPTNALYAEALSFRTYQLEDVSQHCSLCKTGKERNHIIQMALKLSNQHFFGEGHTIVNAFLKRFVRNANIQDMSEAQARVALPLFFNGFVWNQYVACAEMVFAEEGGIFSWLEAARYLLRNYAQL